ncbi:MAG: HlyD family efflux transporter periplasmic adaptor subunit [Acidobacteriia bacterium]|nr:HlyD family efflux transporter periplasmic adaptor subunit [Terriglobia bacterium]
MHTEFHPQLRPDLLTSEQQENGQSIFILKNPDTQRFFRLKRPEYLIARLLDGTHSLSALPDVLQEVHHLGVAPEVLHRFVEKLAQNGLLVEVSEHIPSPDAVPPDQLSSLSAENPFGKDAALQHPMGHMPAPRSGLGRFLYWKIAHFDPDAFLNKLLTLSRFCFTRSFLVISSILIFFSVCITIANWDVIGAETLKLFSTRSILWAFLVMMPIVVFHELAHGLTCKYFGGEVRQMGILLLYFQPACFCNVSDSYLFPKRSHRIWVMGAGIYAQAFLWAIFTLLWRVITPESPVSRLLFISIAVSGIITIFQFNPLLKLDGYYILSELFGIPNLRSRSFRYLGSGLKKLALGASPSYPAASLREKRLYWVYGLVAIFYSFSFLGYYLLKFERYLIDEYQGAGFIFFWGAVLWVAIQPLAASLRKAFPKKAKAKGIPMARHKNIYVSSVLCLCGAALLTFGRWELKVSSECSLLPYERADVRAEVSGVIDRIYFDEGQYVHSGDIIARLADYKYGTEKAKTEAAISEAQAQLQLMLAGASKEDIALAQAQVKRAEVSVLKAESQIPIAKEQVDFAKRNYERSKKMFDEKLLASVSFDEANRDLNIRSRELDEVTRDVEEKKQQYQESQRSLARVSAGPRPEEVAAKRAEIDGLTSQKQLLETESAYTAIRSPIDGVITTHFLKQKEKAFLQQGDIICSVANTAKIITEIPVPEKEVGDVKIGFPVRLKANAYPRKDFEGRVTQISNIADQPDNNFKVLYVRSEINNPDLLLKPEMTGYAKIYCGKRTLGDLVTRRMVRFVRTEFWSWF